MPIKIPENVVNILKKLNDAGYEAYIVGGCVRDSVMGKTPHDWDICTSATPDKIKYLFENTIDFGIKHGTVSVVVNNENYEITTFRTETMYTDHRHPDKVNFVTNLKSDLSRRDFTINAIAYNNIVGFVDLFAGINDINNKVIRCVGSPDIRFQEDALRILRALRFAATLGFKIENNTADAIHRNVHLLQHVAAERKRDELLKLLDGNNTTDVLLEFSDVVAEIIPEIKPCIGFDQNNRYHCYDVYEHMVHAVESGITPVEKFALLVHDIGKPYCYSEDSRGGHFYGHPAVSETITKRIVENFKFDNESKETIVELVKYHDFEIPTTKKSVVKWFNRLGETRILQLMDVKLADISAHAPNTQDALIERWKQFNVLVGEVLIGNACFSRNKLAINGRDIKNLGVAEGPQIGGIITKILNEVIDGEIVNEREVLLKRAKELIINGKEER